MIDHCSRERVDKCKPINMLASTSTLQITTSTQLPKQKLPTTAEFYIDLFCGMTRRASSTVLIRTRQFNVEHTYVYRLLATPSRAGINLQNRGSTSLPQQVEEVPSTIHLPVVKS